MVLPNVSRFGQHCPRATRHCFTRVGIPNFLLRLGERTQSERVSHCFHVCLPAQFDAALHMDETRAVEPLERLAEWRRVNFLKPIRQHCMHDRGKLHILREELR
jgi:hypothetical protein